MTAPLHPLGLEIEGLSIKGAVDLASALNTVFDVLSGLQSQPRFSSQDQSLDAGRVLDGLKDAVAGELATLLADIRHRTVNDREEARDKFRASLLYHSWGDTPSQVVGDLAQLVAEMDIQVFRADGRRFASRECPI